MVKEKISVQKAGVSTDLQKVEIAGKKNKLIPGNGDIVPVVEPKPKEPILPRNPNNGGKTPVKGMVKGKIPR